MNALDVGLVVLAAAGAVVGYHLGLLTRIASWIGLGVGLAVGTVAAPWIVDHLTDTFDSSELVLVSAGVVMVTASFGYGAGMRAGERVRLHVPPGPQEQADRIAGAAAGIFAVAILAWLIAPAMADVAGWPARQARGSVIVAAVDGVFPAPPDASHALRHLLGEDYPAVFEAFDPAPTVDRPPASSGLDQATVDRVARSTVLVRGPACDAITLGSGFVVGEHLVATNAHVVAGETETTVESTDGRSHDASVVAFDPARDIAVLSVPDLETPALPLEPAAEGDEGAVFGHPGGGPLRLAPFTVADARTARGRDIYDEGTALREILVLSSSLQQGDSGSALVTPDGAVIGMAFAVAPDRPDVAYALATSEIDAVLASISPGPVDTGACLP